jgi:RloB-like protein
MSKISRARHRASLRRRAPVRPPYDRVLIVCEGEKTECNYFEEIRQRGRISSAHIHIIPSDIGTDPVSVVKSAEAAFKDKGKSFERIYAVFDRDDHQDYANAIHMACAKNQKLKNDQKQAVAFEAIVSVPCFELWLLLHFSDARSWMHRDLVVKQLRNHISKYEKGMSNLFEFTEFALETATHRAKLLKQTNQRIPGDELYTDVHELVEFLCSFKPARS